MSAPLNEQHNFILYQTLVSSTTLGTTAFARAIVLSASVQQELLYRCIPYSASSYSLF